MNTTCYLWKNIINFLQGKGQKHSQPKLVDYGWGEFNMKPINFHTRQSNGGHQAKRRREGKT
jgi:hypothetical protein